MRKLAEKKGFASLVEVTVTAIIFSLAAAGLFSTISSLRPEATGSQNKLEALYAAKEVLDDLYNQVDAATWDSGDLSVGTHTKSASGGISITYTVSDVSGMNLRKIDMTITYPD